LGLPAGSPRAADVGAWGSASRGEKPRFRTIQVCPKDQLTFHRQAPDASNRLRPASLAGRIDGGTRGREPHVRHQAARVHHGSRRCGSRVAARRARAAPDRMRRVGVLLPATAGDSEYPGLVQAFLTELKQLGWTNNVNIAIDIRWVGGAAEDLRKSAGELAALAPDVIRGTRRPALCCKRPGRSR
jgi:hypothetical protein